MGCFNAEKPIPTPTLLLKGREFLGNEKGDSEHVPGRLFFVEKQLAAA
jgi:hypothetical protein